ncbi:MAG: helix-turn-helix domain-containing protein [Planctomycetes bacterium]|nr:helix-turn-helix domain-containing protein [Planctomycetota bacterium]
MDRHEVVLRDLGDAVQAARKARGLTRRALAQRSGVSERFLAEIEAGRGNPSLLRLDDLALALDASVADLLRPRGADAVGRARALALLGLRGAGKSTVGKMLAAELGWSFVELDAVVEEQSGLALQELFELHGDDYYRRSERQALEHVLAGSDPLVLATGGGLVTEPRTFEVLRQRSKTVWLRAAPEDHWARVVAQGDTRPMQGHDRAFEHLCTILAERERLYRLADATVDTTGRSPEQVCARLVALVG